MLPFTCKPVLLTLFLLFASKNFSTLGCYTSIFSFGDSLTDTGNLAYMDKNDCSNHDPYGETVFHRPTGRCSDGRLIIDFIAQANGLSFIPPYFGHDIQDFGQGVNFAVAGATALDAGGNRSLEYQLEWFKQLLPSLYGSPSDCREKLISALFIMGEIGGNDYAFASQKGIQAMRLMVPNVVHMISSTVTALIKEGAVTLLVPGVEIFGCFPTFLTSWQSPNKDDYDHSTGCLKVLNGFSEFHNGMLQKELIHLRKIHPHATIIYVDYYNAMADMYRFPNQLGFNGGALQVCCGGGGPYNFNASSKCGCGASNVCSNSSLYVNWDGSHLTDAAHKFISTRVLQGGFTDPPINLTCIASKMINVVRAYSR